MRRKFEKNTNRIAVHYQDFGEVQDGRYVAMSFTLILAALVIAGCALSSQTFPTGKYSDTFDWSCLGSIVKTQVVSGYYVLFRAVCLDLSEKIPTKKGGKQGQNSLIGDA